MWMGGSEMVKRWVMKCKAAAAKEEGELMIDEFADENVIAMDYSEVNRDFNEINEDEWRSNGFEGQWLGYFKRFYNEMKAGDLVLVADGTKKILALAKIPKGSTAIFDKESDWFRHKRDVKFIKIFDEPAEFSMPIFGMGAVERVRERKLKAVIIPQLIKLKKIGPNELSTYIQDEIQTKEEEHPIINLLNQKSQIIFYGPPGTGKTYKAREFAVKFIKGGG